MNEAYIAKWVFPLALIISFFIGSRVQKIAKSWFVIWVFMSTVPGLIFMTYFELTNHGDLLFPSDFLYWELLVPGAILVPPYVYLVLNKSKRGDIV